MDTSNNTQLTRAQILTWIENFAAASELSDPATRTTSISSPHQGLRLRRAFSVSYPSVRCIWLTPIAVLNLVQLIRARQLELKMTILPAMAYSTAPMSNSAVASAQSLTPKWSPDWIQMTAC